MKVGSSKLYGLLIFIPLALASLLLGLQLYLIIQRNASIKLNRELEYEWVFNGCDVFSGRWELDPGSHPLFREESCPYLTQPVTCQKNGRPDSLYQNWKWRPRDCELPRFDPLRLLEKLRGKRLMFVGDSLQRTQWESMVCLLQSAIPDHQKSMDKIPPMRIFTAKKFNASIEFYWAPFIVESNADHATKHRVKYKLVNLQSIDKHGRHWKGIDILVFDSYVWWMSNPTINVSAAPYDQVQEYSAPKAYRVALNTWAQWVDSHIDPHNQKVFFMSLSPTHLWSWEWRAGSSGNCYNETHPIQGSYLGVGSSTEMMDIVVNTLRSMNVGVTYINITQLSEYRKDAHTSLYTERAGKLLTAEQRSEPNTYADCIHWCLPGVPDTWNEILHTYLVYHK
ncbi:hypothetical protein AMTRI_Chr01g110830 [Amborella trichopoda]